jgi:hypothetical protein
VYPVGHPVHVPEEADSPVGHDTHPYCQLLPAGFAVVPQYVAVTPPVYEAPNDDAAAAVHVALTQLPAETPATTPEVAVVGTYVVLGAAH